MSRVLYSLPTKDRKLVLIILILYVKKIKRLLDVKAYLVDYGVLVRALL